MDLKAQRAAALKAARDVVDLARKEQRELTDDEHTLVESKMDEVGTLDKQIKGQALVKSVLSLDSADQDPDDDQPGGVQTKGLSLGEHFAKSVGEDGFARLKAQSGFTVAAPAWSAKAATDPQVTTGAALSPLLTEYDRNIVPGYRPRPVVADLLGSGTLAGNAVTYFLEGSLEGDLATVAEGAAKPQFHQGDPTQVTDALRKIAGWFDVSDEMVEDLPFLVSEINQRGLYRLAMVEEQQLLNGSGAGNNVRGLLNRSGIQTEVSAAGGDDDADALFRAMTKIMTATGLGADGIIINPTDYQRLRLRRDANQQYYGGGFFQPQYGELGQSLALNQPIWGMRTIVTQAVAAGTAVVGAFQQAATVYRKGGVRVESTNSDQGKFTSNIITTRIEERIALAVRWPSAIVEVTFTA